MGRWLQRTVVAAAILAAGGCQSAAWAGGEERAGLVAAGLPSTDLVAGDPVLARSLAVRGIETRTREGVLSVAFELGNRTLEDLLLDYRLVWTDAEGLRVEDPDGIWTPLALAPGGSAAVRATAPGPGPVRWSLEVRPYGGER